MKTINQVISFLTIVFCWKFHSPNLNIAPQTTLQSEQIQASFERDDPIILCYHQIRDWTSADSKSDKTYIVQKVDFQKQMEFLYEQGYHNIKPAQWNEHLIFNTPLPEKAFLLTFDDGTIGQFTNALPQLDKYGFKGLFFIMTVSLDKKKFLSKDQVYYLAQHGHLIGCHTWDHQDVRGYKQEDWIKQLQETKKLLEKITKMPIRHFSYPFGSWDNASIKELKKQDFLAAYQLSGSENKNDPNFTLKRILVDGHWNIRQFRNYCN